MSQCRRSHACSKYVTDNGDTVIRYSPSQLSLYVIVCHCHIIMQALMVVSGGGGDTVQIMVKETWSYLASLPSQRAYFMAATLGNYVSVFGK